eukprot:4206481-Pyramimonas_sp.AAC.1
MLIQLNASIAAITCAAQTAPRGALCQAVLARCTNTSVTSRPKNKFHGPPPYPCKYCPGEELARQTVGQTLNPNRSREDSTLPSIPHGRRMSVSSPSRGVRAGARIFSPPCHD